MKATIKSICLNEYTIKKGDNAGRKFKKFDFVVTVVTDTEKGFVKEYKGSMSEDYGRKYFKHCGYTSTGEVVGKDCEVTLQKRQFTNGDGETRTITEVRYLNMLNEDGNPIRLNEGESSETTF